MDIYPYIAVKTFLFHNFYLSVHNLTEMISHHTKEVMDLGYKTDTRYKRRQQSFKKTCGRELLTAGVCLANQIDTENSNYTFDICECLSVKFYKAIRITVKSCFDFVSVNFSIQSVRPLDNSFFLVIYLTIYNELIDRFDSAIDDAISGVSLYLCQDLAFVSEST